MNARPHLEKAALSAHFEPDMSPTEREVAQSVAISLKRIADALENIAGCVRQTGKVHVFDVSTGGD